MTTLSVIVALALAAIGAVAGSYLGRRALRGHILSATAASEAAESALAAQRQDTREHLQV